MPAVVVLIKYKTVVFEEVYILFHFNIILLHNGMSSTKTEFGFINIMSNFKTNLRILYYSMRC